MFEYPATLTPADEGGFVVTFADVPEAITQGDTHEEALLAARDALETALSMYVDDRRDLPRPGAGAGRALVSPGAIPCAKLGIYAAMRRQGVSKAELARRLHWHMPQVDRLLDLNHASRFTQLEQAAAALGQRVVLAMEPAA
ncbi:MAG: type II toxin-antitoxin system HicB family antitoxin [Nitrospirae bacterium]|nr:type II toxin-antitoxin system HicB family antitoxin [Nitrospirota bacterium]